MKNNNQQVANRLKALRKQGGHTQDEVAKALNLYRTTYNALEKNGTIQEHQLIMLQQAYGWNPEYILNGESNASSATGKHTKTSEIPQWKEMMEMIFNIANDLNNVKKDIMTIKGNLNFKTGVAHTRKVVPFNGQQSSEQKKVVGWD